MEVDDNDFSKENSTTLKEILIAEEVPIKCFIQFANEFYKKQLFIEFEGFLLFYKQTFYKQR